MFFSHCFSSILKTKLIVQSNTVRLGSFQDSLKLADQTSGQRYLKRVLPTLVGYPNPKVTAP